MQRNRTAETSFCQFGFICSFSLPVVLHLACSRYLFAIFFLFSFYHLIMGTEFRRTIPAEDQHVTNWVN